MNPSKFHRHLNRRRWLASAGGGLGALALHEMLAPQAHAAGGPGSLPHFAAKAKRVIFLFMSGGISQFESFDHKPELVKHHGEDLPASLLDGKKPLGMSSLQARFPLVASKWPFQQHGTGADSQGVDTTCDRFEILPDSPIRRRTMGRRISAACARA